MTNIKIKLFDPTRIRHDCVCVFIGKRGTGKTTLVTDILHKLRKIPVGLCVSGTEASSGYYSAFIPDLFIHTEYSTGLLDNLIANQKKILRKSNKKDIRNAAFALLDDCMYDNSLGKDKTIRAVFMNGRHWNMLFMLTMQYCMDIPPALRANIDYVFLLRESIQANRERMWKNFAGIFPTYQMFSEVFNQCTSDFECMVIDNPSRSNDIEDCVFWYKAKPKQAFKCGSKELWDYHYQNFNEHYESDEDKKTTRV